MNKISVFFLIFNSSSYSRSRLQSDLMTDVDTTLTKSHQILLDYWTTVDFAKMADYTS